MFLRQTARVGVAPHAAGGADAEFAVKRPGPGAADHAFAQLGKEGLGDVLRLFGGDGRGSGDLGGEVGLVDLIAEDGLRAEATRWLSG